MDNVKWESLVIEINEYLEADDSLDAALRQVVELHLQVGQENENEREAAANALKALLRGRDVDSRSVAVKSLPSLRRLESQLTVFVVLLKKPPLVSTTMTQLWLKFSSSTPSRAVAFTKMIRNTPLLL